MGNHSSRLCSTVLDPTRGVFDWASAAKSIGVVFEISRGGGWDNGVGRSLVYRTERMVENKGEVGRKTQLI